jgi:aquaporin Z
MIEGAELGLFMISACAFVVLLEYPTSPVHQSIPDPFLRRILIGMAMGLTAIGIIYSPLGQRSGAHFNPLVTLTFFRLGKVERKYICGSTVYSRSSARNCIIITTNAASSAVASMN